MPWQKTDTSFSFPIINLFATERILSSEPSTNAWFIAHAIQHHTGKINMQTATASSNSFKIMITQPGKHRKRFPLSQGKEVLERFGHFPNLASRTMLIAGILSSNGVYSNLLYVQISNLECWGPPNFERLVLRCIEADFLRPNTHFAAFFEIYKISIPLHRSDLENSVKNRHQFCEIEY